MNTFIMDLNPWAIVIGCCAVMAISRNGCSYLRKCYFGPYKMYLLCGTACCWYMHEKLETLMYISNGQDRSYSCNQFRIELYSTDDTMKLKFDVLYKPED